MSDGVVVGLLDGGNQTRFVTPLEVPEGHKPIIAASANCVELSGVVHQIGDGRLSL